jgi:hypothetical protein
MATPNHLILLSGTVAAITLHEFILRRVEVDHLALPIIVGSTTLFWVGVYCSSFSFATFVAAAFWVPLTIWILVYRTLWHPLRKFPGPLGAKCTKLWTVKKTWDTDWHYHHVVFGLQKEYGDYVRTGKLHVYQGERDLVSSHGTYAMQILTD